MKRKQICNQIHENQSNPHQVFFTSDPDLTQSFLSISTEEYVTQKLKDILQCLQKQKNQLLNFHYQEKEALTQRINEEKDKIIDDLLKSIHNLKKQNDQLKFQYKRRFKLVKNIQEKYNHLLMSKSKKITEYESILKYLETKIKFLQKKLEKFEAQERMESSKIRQFLSPNYQKSYLSPTKNKISLIVSKQINPKDTNKKKYVRNSLDQFTIPLTSSFITQGKGSQSSKTIARKKIVGKSQKDDYDRLKGHFIENDVYSSFLTSTQKNFNPFKIDTDTNIEDFSNINPLSLQNTDYGSKHLSLGDFEDLESKQFRLYECPMRKSQSNRVEPFQNMYTLN